MCIHTLSHTISCTVNICMNLEELVNPKFLPWALIREMWSFRDFKTIVARATRLEQEIVNAAKEASATAHRLLVKIQGTCPNIFIVN